MIVRSIGAITGVGDDAPNTMAGILAELQLFEELGVRGSRGARLSGAISGLPRRLRGIDRLAALGLVALTECTESGGTSDPLPMLVCAPATDELTREPGALVDRMIADASVAIDRRHTHVFATGRSATADALTAANQLLSATARSVLVVGVDSLSETKRLEQLWSQRLVFDVDNKDGFLPGEAGVCLMLTSDRERAAHGLATVHVATARAGIGNADPSGALSDAFEEALSHASADAAAIEALVHDGNGSRGHSEELTLATGRGPCERLRDDIRIIAPADYVGEIGAASGPLAVAVAAFFAGEGALGGPSLVACLAGASVRTAAVVARLPALL